MIAIIDYDAGNIKSVEKALNYLGEEAIITRDHDEIVNSDKVILPGVGAFADAMEKIRHYGLEDTIHEVVEKNIPFLGICLGLQLMFESSDEGPGVKGLGLLPGKILRISKSGDLKIPHMGWNNIKVKEDSRLFKGLPENPYVYFVHSYYLQADDEDIVAVMQNLGHKVVAEGVETQEEIDLLKQWGVDLVQGYYYTKPLDSEQIIHKLEKDVC